MKYNQRIFKRAVVQILYENGFTLVDLCDEMGVGYEQMYNWFSILHLIPSDTCEAILKAVEDIAPKDWLREYPDWKKLDAPEYDLATDVYRYFKEVVQLLNAESDIKNIKENYPTLHILHSIGWRSNYTLSQVFSKLGDMLDKEVQIQEEAYAFTKYLDSLKRSNVAVEKDIKPIKSIPAIVPATTDETQPLQKFESTCIELDSDIYAELLRVSDIVDIPVTIIVNSIVRKKLNGN